MQINRSLQYNVIILISNFRLITVLFHGDYEKLAVAIGLIILYLIFSYYKQIRSLKWVFRIYHLNKHHKIALNAIKNMMQTVFLFIYFLPSFNGVLVWQNSFLVSFIILTEVVLLLCQLTLALINEETTHIPIT